MKKFEEIVEMVALTVLLLGLGLCIGIGITELIMFTECFTDIAIELFGAITVLTTGFWIIKKMLSEIDEEVEED